MRESLKRDYRVRKVKRVLRNCYAAIRSSLAGSQVILIKIKAVSMLAYLWPSNLMNLQLLIAQDAQLEVRIRLDFALVILALKPSLILEDILERISLGLQTAPRSLPALDLRGDVDNLWTSANPVLGRVWLIRMRGRVSRDAVACCIPIWLGLMREDRAVVLRILDILVLMNVINLPASPQPGYGFYQISIVLSLGKEHPASTLILCKFHVGKGRSDHTLPMRAFHCSSYFRPVDVPRMRGLPRDVGVVVAGLVVTVDGFIFVR